MGYQAQPFKEITNNDKNALLYCKTNIGGFFFDGFLKVSHDRRLTTTKNPVETGASIVDHAYMEPSVITMDIIMSDTHESLISEQFVGGYARHVQAWQILKELQENRIPMFVFTKLDSYENMVITSMQADDTADTYSSLRATVELTEIPVARVKEVQITSAEQTVIETEMGKITAYSDNKTTLNEWISSFKSFISGG